MPFRGSRGGFLSGLGAVTIGGDTTISGNLTVAGTTTVAAGTVASPSIKFTGSDPGSGFYASTADQLEIARLGVLSLRAASSAGLQANTTTNMAGQFLISERLRIDAEAIKTVSYTIGTGDAIIIMNDGGGAALTATLPLSPSADQVFWIKNRGTGALTVARNSQTIDGAAADLSLAAGGQAMLYFEPSGWIRLGA